MNKFSKSAFLLIIFLGGLVSIISIPVYSVLIDRQTVTDQSSVEFTGLTSMYANYLIVGNNVTNPSFAGNFFGIQISTDGGSTYIDTDYSSQFVPLSVIGIFNPWSSSNASFEVLITNMSSGLGNIQASGTGVICNDIIPGCYAFNCGGGYMVAETVADALRLVGDDGSTFSGTFTLYGYE